MAGKSTISITFKLDGDAKGFKDLIKDGDDLKKVMTAAIKEADSLNKSLINLSQGVQALDAVSNAVNQLNNTFQGLTAESREFGAAMKATNTMAGKDADGLGKLKDQVSEVSKVVPVARDVLANGLYQVISNGVPEDNWINFLLASSKSSVGGLADLNKVVTVTSTVIKNYGLEWDRAASIQDKIQLTAKNGVTSFEQLSEALPRVTGNAATLGVSIDELLGSFATLTGVSGNTAEVSTQLAAIFTALVKPSSEATEMAAKMGITFNAASIKAAGGLQNFLTFLDATVKSYAVSSGMLEQEIYAKLFGSAEALRALIPLNGELSDKFSANVADMQNSAGTIDAAFAEMSTTGAATTQMLKNQTAAFRDVIASVVGAAGPYINFAANAGITTMSLVTLVKTLKQLNIVQAIVIAKNKAAGASMLLFGLRTSQAAAVTRVFSAALRTGAFSATALKIAIRGLMIATAVGAVIAGVTALIEYFVNKTDAATESTEQFNEAEEAYKSAAASAKVELDKEIKALGDLIRAKKDTTEAVKHLNETYGAVFGSHKTAAEWYDVLTRKSKIYVKQIGYEAQAKVLATRLAEKQIELENNYAKRRDLWKTGRAKETATRLGSEWGANGKKQLAFVKVQVDTDEYAQLKKDARQLIPEISDLQRKLGIATDQVNSCAKEMAEMGSQVNNATAELKVNEMTWQQVTTAIEATEKKLKNTTDPAEIKQLKAYNAQLTARKKTLTAMLGLSSGNGGSKKTVTADPKTYEELSNNIEIYKKKLTGANTEEQKSILASIAAWEKQRQAIAMAQKQAERPASLDTLQDIDKEISYQRTLRAAATSEQLAGIDAEISRLEELRAQLERNAHIPTPVDQIQTYQQLNDEISYYNDLLSTATATQRENIQLQINKLTELKKKWDDVLDGLKKPGDISTLDTIDKLDDAITYYQGLQRKQSAEEIQNTQRTIDALEAKKKALERGIKIPSMQKEINEVNALGGKDFKLKVRSYGFDELTDKIRELKKELADLDNPVTAGQRKDIEEMIATYESWRAVAANSFDTYRQGWDGIKGIGQGIESITNALTGNGNAWQKTVALVDGFLALYDGINTVVSIINLLSAASAAHAATKAVEAGAETTEAATRTASTTANITASAAQIGINKLETASWTALAAAKTVAAHAYIPFAGTAIAAGFIAAQKALIIAAGIPAFAEGGIAFGPTLGLFGEYAGASNNPEVVAPLDKLRSMIKPDDAAFGKVEFEIKGRRLVGVLTRENNLIKRS